jgi:hypothetical protein
MWKLGARLTLTDVAGDRQILTELQPLSNNSHAVAVPQGSGCRGSGLGNAAGVVTEFWSPSGLEQYKALARKESPEGPLDLPKISLAVSCRPEDANR